jgi:hypothetical protein
MRARGGREEGSEAPFAIGQPVSEAIWQDATSTQHPMRLNPTFTVSNQLLSTPQDITRYLRKYFTDMGADAFSTDEEDEFSFPTEMDGRPMKIVVQTNQERNRLLLLTLFLGKTKRTESALNELAAALNRRMLYSTAIVVNEEQCTFAFESWLMLDDGACLAGQVERLADTHREAVAWVGPLVVRMLAGQINTTKIISALADQAAPELEEDSSGSKTTSD